MLVRIGLEERGRMLGLQQASQKAVLAFLASGASFRSTLLTTGFTGTRHRYAAMQQKGDK